MENEKEGAAQLSADEIELMQLFDSCRADPIEFVRRLREQIAAARAEEKLLALGVGGVCSNCGFAYWEYRGHIIPCPVCECERLRAVADAANAFVPHWNRTWDEDEDPTIQQETGDALVAAVRALERGEVKS